MCGTAPAGTLDVEELLPIELLECVDFLTPTQEPSITKNCLESSAKGGLFLKLPIAPHRVLESAIFHFPIEFFWQELDIVLVGPGLQQIATTNQAASALGP